MSAQRPTSGRYLTPEDCAQGLATFMIEDNLFANNVARSYGLPALSSANAFETAVPTGSYSSSWASTAFLAVVPWLGRLEGLRNLV